MPVKYLFSSHCLKHLRLIKLKDCIISLIKEPIITFTFAINTANKKNQVVKGFARCIKSYAKFSPNVQGGGLGLHNAIKDNDVNPKISINGL